MSELKNPFESLQNYFDELLDDDFSSLESLAPATSSAPVPPKTTALSATPVAATQTKSSAAPAVPRFADPEIEKKEKLQKLLSSARSKIEVEPITKTAFVVNTQEIQEWVVETAPVKIAPVIKAAPVVETVVVAEQEEMAVAQGFKIPGLDWMPNGLPQWAQARFDVLLFKVSGLTLAVPLISLGTIQPITDELTPLFGQADWFMGLQPTSAGKIRTVNTAKFVMPERYDENFVKNAKYVVSINGVPWGLAVDSVNQPISLEPDAVKWRSDRSKRPWLAGTVKDHMCALLDIPMIGQMLMDADKNAMKSRW